MKLSLTKSYVNRRRLLGLNQAQSRLDQSGSSVASLYDQILSLNHLQLTDKKIYFQINQQDEFVGPFVSILGNASSNEGFTVFDLIEMDYYHSVLADKDALLLGKDSFYQQLFTLLKSIEGKISFKFAYLSIELAKIELHLFVK